MQIDAADNAESERHQPSQLRDLILLCDILPMPHLSTTDPPHPPNIFPAPTSLICMWVLEAA